MTKGDGEGDIELAGCLGRRRAVWACIRVVVVEMLGRSNRIPSQLPSSTTNDYHGTSMALRWFAW